MAFTGRCPFSAITLNGLRLLVRLGCKEEERHIPQYVRFDVKVRFSELPQGCSSDQLEETVCYALLSQKVHEVCDRAEYALIEKLGWEVFRSLKEILPPSCQLWIRVLKEKPPIPEPLNNGASFCLGDWAEF